MENNLHRSQVLAPVFIRTVQDGSQMARVARKHFLVRIMHVHKEPGILGYPLDYISIKDLIDGICRLSQDLIGAIQILDFERTCKHLYIQMFLDVGFHLPFERQEEYNRDVCFHRDINADHVLFRPDHFIYEKGNKVLSFPHLRLNYSYVKTNLHALHVATTTRVIQDLVGRLSNKWLVVALFGEPDVGEVIFEVVLCLLVKSID